jgi:DNA-binding MarR family transcriptional regulator
MRIEDEIQQEQFRSEHERVLVNLIFTAGWLEGHQARFLRSYDLSSQQYNILRILRGQGKCPATVNLLMDRMLDKQSNASRLVEKLRLKGLAERSTCGNDRRRVDVTITPKGLKLLQTIDTVLYQHINSVVNITDAQAQHLNELLDKLRERTALPQLAA